MKKTLFAFHPLNLKMPAPMFVEFPCRPKAFLIPISHIMISLGLRDLNHSFLKRLAAFTCVNLIRDPVQVNQASFSGMV
jgi:hypothetical protein